MPRGGRRSNGGRKPAGAVELAITGNQHTHGRVLKGPGGDGPGVAPPAVFDPPADLNGPARAVWVQLAPHAFAARTLTRGTELAFVLLCHTVVLERTLRTTEAGGPSHRGLIQRVEGGLCAFNLRPFGKPIYEAAPQAPANPLDRFIQKA